MQRVHIADAVVDWLWPGGQSVHVVVSVALAARYLPTAHGSQSDEALSAKVPAGHRVQSVAPDVLPVVLSESHIVHD